MNTATAVGGCKEIEAGSETFSREVEQINLPQSSSRVHLAYLDGLRAIAALYVLFNHLKWTCFGTGTGQQGLAGVLCCVFGYGHEAVTLFIMLSGFCLTLPVLGSGEVLRSGSLRFFIKRARRIIPPYYCALVLSLILDKLVIGQKTGRFWDCALPITANAIYAHIFLVQDLFSSLALKIDHPLWSISVEWRIYFLFPLLLLCWRRYGAAATTGATFAIAFLAAAVCEYRFHYEPSLEYIGVFALGMLAAKIAYSSGSQFSHLRSLRWDLASLPCLALCVFCAEHSSWSLYKLDFAFSLMCFCLLLCVSRPNPNAFGDLLKSSKIARLGLFSYSLYLIHAPLLQIFYEYAFRSLQDRPMQMFAVLTFVAVPAIVAISYWFYLLFERPFTSSKTVQEI